MARPRSCFTPAFSLDSESLESRIVLSASSIAQGTVMVAAQSVRNAATQTTVSVQAGTLGQPITISATVRAPASAGSPQGTVELLDHGNLLHTLTLSPSSTSGNHATSQATYTLTPQPGGPASFFGKHVVTAEFIPSGSFSKSVASKTFTVAQPSYTTLAGGVKVATIVPGSGPAIRSGQTANVLYTGYLAKTGQIFDESSSHGGSPLSFKLGAGLVVPGFDSGTADMHVGETRIILIPAAQGYGASGNGPIPANSTLLFVVTLESIS